MKKSKNKFSFSKYLKQLNELDINIIISKARELNVKDLKNIDLKKLKSQIIESNLFKPTIGLIGAGFLFSLLLYPSAKQLIANFKLANKYEIESKSITEKISKLKKIEEKLKKANFLMSDINQAIIKKEDILYISKLINQTAIKSNIEIISFLPIDAARSAKLCKMSNRNTRKKNSRRTKNKSPKKGSFQDNFFEITLKSNYLDMIKFLNLIQNYDVVILPNCLKVALDKDEKDLTSIEKNNKTNIFPIPESGEETNASIINSKSIKSNSYHRVQSRLVLQIPSHSKS